MADVCRNCGSTPIVGARFCRACGAALPRQTVSDDGTPISPFAQTIPLSGEAVQTSGFGHGDTGSSLSNTTKVPFEEMENLLRQTPIAALHEPYAEAPPTETVADVLKQSGEVTSPLARPGGLDPLVIPLVQQRRTWQVLSGLLLCVALAAGALAFLYSRRQVRVEANSNEASPISLSDQKKLIDAKLSEAATLLASGDTEGAITKLRYAVRLDPGNSLVHQRLGEALEKNGQANDAIDEFRAATLSDPGNSSALRSLATLQFAQGHFDDSSESYRRFVSVIGDSAVDGETWFAYADSLAAAGRTEEARALYQRLAASGSFELAQRANSQLAKLPPPPRNDPNPNDRDTALRVPTIQDRTADMNLLPPLSVASARPPQVPASQPLAPAIDNRLGLNNTDQFYYEALNIVQGRDVKSLQRAELLRALQLFMNVRAGAHSADAQKHVERLGKEYDRRRKIK